MAGSVNKVILIGNLGKDPEVRYLENGTGVANFSIATSETFTDKNTGEKRVITDWHNIVLWRGLAKIAETYLKKGITTAITTPELEENTDIQLIWKNFNPVNYKRRSTFKKNIT